MQKTDPFLHGMNRMINQEDFIYQTDKSRDLNIALVERLKRVKSIYEEKVNTRASNEYTQSLKTIYHLLKLVNEIPLVKVQLEAIISYHAIVLKSSEIDNSKGS